MQAELLHADVDSSVRALRVKLRSLLVGIGVDSGKPQEMHRRFKLDRGLCWKISRITTTQTTEEALQHLPGTSAFETFLQAVAQDGANSDSVENAQQAMQIVSASLKKHVGDRGTLEIMLDSASPKSDALIVSRKLAFRGNSGIWGIQARTRAHLQMFAPNLKNPDLVDTATVAGWVDVRRIRPNAQWCIFRRRNRTQDAPPPFESFDPSQTAGGAMLLPDFCSNIPPIITEVKSDWSEFTIGPTSAGAAGAFTLYSGFIQRGHGRRYGNEPGDCAEFAAHILAPAEHLMFDLVFHRSLSFLKNASMYISSTAFNDGSERTPDLRLPINAEREDSGSPPVVATMLAPNFDKLLDAAYTRCGWKAEDFEGIRFHISYPPFPSIAVLHVPLEPPPSAS